MTNDEYVNVTDSRLIGINHFDVKCSRRKYVNKQSVAYKA